MKGREAAAVLAAGFLTRHPSEAASVVEELSPKEAARVLGLLRPQDRARAVEALSFDRAVSYLERVESQAFPSVLAALEPARGALLLSRMKEEIREERLSTLPENLAKDFRELLRYPPDSAGRLMDSRVLALRETDTVAAALKKIRENKERRFFDALVVDGEGHLSGAVSLQDLALAEPRHTLGTLMQRRIPSIGPLAPGDEVAELFAQHKMTTLPVVHVTGLLLGAIRHDTLVESARDEATSDLVSMVGADPNERSLSPVTFAVSKRLPWLAINLLTAFLASAVVAIFESTIARITALAVLLPIVAGQSGNTGAQAMAVTMRGLALREIRVRQGLRVLLKEVRVGLLNGLAVALLTAAAVIVWSGDRMLGGVIGAAMVLSMAVASVAGAGIPILLTALGKDPAQSSSIVLTTVTDVVGFLSFLGLASLFASTLAP